VTSACPIYVARRTRDNNSASFCHEPTSVPGLGDTCARAVYSVKVCIHDVAQPNYLSCPERTFHAGNKVFVTNPANLSRTTGSQAYVSAAYVMILQMRSVYGVCARHTAFKLFSPASSCARHLMTLHCDLFLRILVQGRDGGTRRKAAQRLESASCCMHFNSVVEVDARIENRKAERMGALGRRRPSFPGQLSGRNGAFSGWRNIPFFPLP
jgi:hypothetical protein